MKSSFTFPPPPPPDSNVKPQDEDNNTKTNLEIVPPNMHINTTSASNQDPVASPHHILNTDINITTIPDIETDVPVQQANLFQYPLPLNTASNDQELNTPIPINQATGFSFPSQGLQTVTPPNSNFLTIDIPSPIEVPNHNIQLNQQKIDMNDHMQPTSNQIDIGADYNGLQKNEPINILLDNGDNTIATATATTNNKFSHDNYNMEDQKPPNATESYDIGAQENITTRNTRSTTVNTSIQPLTNDYISGLRQEMATERKSPSEYALHILFTKFIRQAEDKLNLCSEYPLDVEPPVGDILNEGADPKFDKIIESLGHIARKKPKPVIDAMMFWRKSKSEIANTTSDELDVILKEYETDMTNNSNQVISPTNKSMNPKPTKSNSLRKISSNSSLSLPKRVTSLKSNTPTRRPTETTKLIELQNVMEKKKIDVLQANRKSLVSIYILCRVLIEIVKQTPDNADEHMTSKLEEIVFTQLKMTDPFSISSSVIKSSNWNSFAQILGCMSESRFLSVSDRFIAELEKVPANLSPETESKIHLLILGMRYLKLKHYPLENFEQSADYMKSISKFFARTDNISLRLAYADVVNQLLLSLAGAITVEINHPTWVEAMENLLICTRKLTQNTKYWSIGFTLGVSILCVSPPQLFTERWIKLLESNIDKIKTKDISERAIYAVGLSRLVWVYLYRSSETLNNTIRTLTTLLQLYLNPKKKENWLTTDFSLINPLSDSLVSIGHLYPEFLMENAMIPLIKQSFNGLNLDINNYDKLLLAITTYGRFLITNKKPLFPEAISRTYSTDLNKISVSLHDPLYSSHEEICLYIYKLFILLDSSIGSEVWSPENMHQKQPSTPFGSFSFSFSNDNENQIQKNNANFVLFSKVIETIPCCLSITKKIPYKSAIEILTRNAVHANKVISTSSKNSLKTLASKKNPHTCITWFAKYSFDFDEKTQSSYNMQYLSSNEYSVLLLLYVELLECWLKEFTSSKTEEKEKTIGLDGIRLLSPDTNHDNISESEKLEWKNTVTVIEEVEGNGLFFLCAHDPRLRRLAIKILRIISRFDEAMTEKTENMSSGHSRSSSFHFAADRGSRLIDFLNNVNVISLLSPQKLSLSAAEKSRLVKLSSKYKKGLALKIAESTYGIDAALWQRIFPKLLIEIFKSSPVTMALCRSIVCIRLVQVHEVILKIANDVDFKPSNILPETIINQWKLYLIAACTSLTSTTDQKLHIPTQVQQHGRKKSQQIFTVQHQKIKSAKAIFKMVLPLLNAKRNIVKEAIIIGLSSMNINIFKTFLESIYDMISNWTLDNLNYQTRIEIFHIVTILSRFLKEPTIINDYSILKMISQFLKQVKSLLEDESVQMSYEYQFLRSYFAELLARYYSTIRDNEKIDELFPFEARVSCFNYLKEWCGYGDYSNVAIERYNHMINQTQNLREKTAVTTGIEFQKSRLEVISLEAMVILCSKPITHVLYDSDGIPIVISFNIAGLLSWIESLFNAENENIRTLGVRALENLLENNTNNVELFKDVSLRCISPHRHSFVAVHYYITLCKSILKLDALILEEHELVTLGLYGLVSDKEDTRACAIDLLSAVETNAHNSSYTKVFKERLTNSSKSVYKATAIEISSIFVELLSPDLCLCIFSSLVRLLDLFPFKIKRDLLILMDPWVNKFILKTGDDLDTHMVLTNLFYVTIELNDSLPNEVEQLWIALGKGNSFQNIHVCVEYIIITSMSNKNPLFVEKARDVILYLANISGGLGLTDTLLNNLEPKSMIPNSKLVPNTMIDEENKFSFIANIWKKLNYTGRPVMFSKAQLSIIFLVNLLTDINEFVQTKIPTLLHVSICLLDHYVPLIQESASRIICNLIFGLAPTHEKSEETISLLRNKHGRWSYDNLVKDKKGARSPRTMDTLVRNIVSILSETDNIQDNWQRCSLKWATTCSVRHIACRSFQVFRSLLSFLDQTMLRDMLHRLSNTVADENSDIQGFAMQILMTLNAITAELDANDLIGFPQLFWSLIACLSTIHEQEFIEVLSCVTKFISKIDLDSPDTVQCLVATFPSNWEGRFDGLQQIVMIGLRSSNSIDMTIKFLDRLNLLKDSRIIADSESRLLFALISNLPRFLNAMTQNDYSSIQASSDSLISLADANNEPSLSRLVDSLSKNKFRSKKDFLSQIVSFIARTYFPKYAAQTLVFLLGLLLNKLDWIKKETLEILKYIFPLVDLTQNEFTGVGADLISPLLRLLITDYERQALDVLDNISELSGSKMDKDILRITMGNDNIKSLGNNTTTLFGLPEESGWSIPMPTMTAAMTRHNVHTVFMSCSNSSDIEEIPQETNIIPDDDLVEFHQDLDYGLNRMDTSESYSSPKEKDPTLSHMWAELDNLDSFFTKPENPSLLETHDDTDMPHARSDSIDTTNTTTINNELNNNPKMKYIWF